MWHAFPHRDASIRRNLINSISVVFGLIVLIVFISVDRTLDIWVEKQFDSAMIHRASYLQSAVTMSDGRVTFHFDKQFIPEFKSDNKPYFYQFWQAGKTIRRSATLQQYPQLNLIKSETALNRNRVIDITLPNGEPGRALLSYFQPHNKAGQGKAEPVYMTIYEPAKGLEHILVLVDILLVTSFILAMALMRYLAVTIVSRGLKPLEQLNLQLKAITEQAPLGIQSIRPLSQPQKLFSEIEPIRSELNTFIETNRQLLSNEKRITGDIAHELKTPIAEIIALSEVYIRYPDDERIGATYKHDMLAIATRMKKIVESLLLLQRTSSLKLQVDLQCLAVQPIFERLIRDLGFKYTDIEQRLNIQQQGVTNVTADRFSFETIVTNLVDNALFYSPAGSKVDIKLSQTEESIELRISNQPLAPLSDNDLKHIVQPLFQLDTSRTSKDRYGLGLSIVSNICMQNHYSLQLFQSQVGEFVASVTLPHVKQSQHRQQA